MKPINVYINESSVKFKKIEDIERYLSNFRDDETSWNGAGDEIRDIARYSREFLEEYDNIKTDPMDFRALKTPSEWNTMGKEYIMNNITKMSKKTQGVFFNYINDYFN